MANTLAQYFRERQLIENQGLPRWHGISYPSEEKAKDFATTVQEEALHDRARALAQNPDPMYLEIQRQGSALDLTEDDDIELAMGAPA